MLFVIIAVETNFAAFQSGVLLFYILTPEFGNVSRRVQLAVSFGSVLILQTLLAGTYTGSSQGSRSELFHLLKSCLLVVKSRINQLKIRGYIWKSLPLIIHSRLVLLGKSRFKSGHRQYHRGILLIRFSSETITMTLRHKKTRSYPGLNFYLHDEHIKIMTHFHIYITSFFITIFVQYITCFIINLPPFLSNICELS